MWGLKAEEGTGGSRAPSDVPLRGLCMHEQRGLPASSPFLACWEEHYNLTFKFRLSSGLMENVAAGAGWRALLSFQCIWCHRREQGKESGSWSSSISHSLCQLKKGPHTFLNAIWGREVAPN